MKMRNLTVTLIVVIGVLGGFYSGWRYSQGRVAAGSAAAQTQVVVGAGGGTGTGATGASGGGLGRGGVVAGLVTAVGTGTLTVHDRITNSDVKVSFDAGTPILKSSPGQVSDLISGATVTVTGSKAADGTVAAQGIQLGGARGAGGG